MDTPENKNDVFEPMPGEPEVQPAAGDAAAANPEEMAQAKKYLWLGLLWCGGGLAFSFISYYFTTAGSRYVVATGAIIWGALQALRGVATILKVQYRAGKFTAFWRTAAIAACSAALLIYLGQLSLWADDGAGEPTIAQEQYYACDSLGLRVTVPPGYVAIQTVGQPETQESYAFYQLQTYNNDIGVNIEGVVNYIDPEQVQSIADMKEHCYQRDSGFYNAGFIAPTQLVEIGGRQMLNSEGRTSEYPDIVYSSFDMIHGTSLISVNFWYQEKDYGKTQTRLQIEKLLAGVRFD